VININFIEIPPNHFFCNWDFQWSESILHQSSKLLDIYEIILIALEIWFFSILGSFTKEMRKLYNIKCTYSSKVIFPSLFWSMRLKCQSSWSWVILLTLTPRLSARRTLSSWGSRVELLSLS
jgi:hypothetical protein